MKWISSIFLLLPMIVFAQNPYDVSLPLSKEKKIDNRSELGKRFNYLPITSWKEGMHFIVLPPFDSAYNDDLNIFPDTKSKRPIESLKQKEWAYKIFTFKRLEEIKEDGLPTAVAILENEGKLYKYKFFGSLEMMKEHPELNNLRNFCYTDEIDSARNNLLGKDVYILSPYWKIKTNSGIGFQKEGVRKFIRVSITQVGLGDQDNPIRVVFKPENGNEAFVDIRLTGINSLYTEYPIAMPFDSVFTFSDPKLLHPSITPDNWMKISEGKISIGMNEEELILAFGKPQHINITVVGGKSMRQYVYADTYVYLDNGTISSFQTSK